MRRARDLNSSCVAEHVGIWNVYLPRFMDKYEHLENLSHTYTSVWRGQSGTSFLLNLGI